MLYQRGLAPFYRPAIRAVQTAQELQIVRGAVLGFEEVVRAKARAPSCVLKRSRICGGVCCVAAPDYSNVTVGAG